MNKNLTKKPKPPKDNVVTAQEKLGVEESIEQEKQGEGNTKDKETGKESQTYIPPPPYKPLIPYPKVLNNQN